MSLGKEINSSSIEFIPGEQVEIYFPEEQIEYRFTVSETIVEGYEDCLVVDIPTEFSNNFYKGEDFIKCRYVHKNIVYEFGGDIIKIIHGKKPCVIIKKPTNLTQSNSRAKDRVSIKILCEYFIQEVVPGLENTASRGFATVKDASMGGVSFLTTDHLPINTIIKMDMLKSGLSLIVEIKKHQIVNEKNFYGGRIIDFVGGCKENYRSYIEAQIRDDEDNIYSNRFQ